MEGQDPLPAAKDAYDDNGPSGYPYQDDFDNQGPNDLMDPTYLANNQSSETIN